MINNVVLIGRLTRDVEHGSCGRQFSSVGKTE